MSDTSGEPRLFSDLALARRLERTEARSGAEFVETRAMLFPMSNARWIEVAGAYAMYDGPTSPVTQTFGLGMFDTITRAEMETIEEFYREFDSPVFHEVSPHGRHFGSSFTEREGLSSDGVHQCDVPPH